MTIRKRESRDGKSRLFIEIRYRTADGRSMRFRRDASVQTRTAALAEERRLLAELERTGTLERVPTSSAADSKEPEPVTFSEAVRHFRATHMKTLKPSTRITYNERLDRVLLPRFGEVKLPELDGEKLQALDAKLLNEQPPRAASQEPSRSQFRLGQFSSPWRRRRRRPGLQWQPQQQASCGASSG
jgi:hypothetical protein